MTYFVELLTVSKYGFHSANSSPCACTWAVRKVSEHSK